MFRRLLSSQVGLRQSQQHRWSEIARFACLRASLNTESTKAFQDLAKQNNLTPQQLVDISQVVTLDLEYLQDNISNSNFPAEKEAALSRFRQSRLGTQGKLQDVHASVVAKHPTIGAQLGAVAGYKEAYAELKTLFLGDAPAHAQLTSYIKNLNEVHKTDTETVSEIHNSLQKIIENLSLDRAGTQARLRTVLHSRGHLPQPNGTYVTLEKSYPTNLDLDAVFIQQENQAILNRLGLGAWENDRKVIFSAVADYKLEFPYLLVALLCGASFAYFLYSGDAKYKTLLLTPVVGVAALLLLQKNQIANSQKILTKLLLHKDGKHVDAILTKGCQTSTINGVPIANLKLARGDPQMTVNISDSYLQDKFAADGYKQVNNNGDFSFSFAKIRSRAASQGQLLTIGDQQVVVPFIHEGNRLLLKSVLNGANVLPTV